MGSYILGDNNGDDGDLFTLSGHLLMEQKVMADDNLETGHGLSLLHKIQMAALIFAHKTTPSACQC